MPRSPMLSSRHLLADKRPPLVASGMPNLSRADRDVPDLESLHTVHLGGNLSYTHETNAGKHKLEPGGWH